MIQNTNT